MKLEVQWVAMIGSRIQKAKVEGTAQDDGNTRKKWIHGGIDATGGILGVEMARRRQR